MNDASSVEWVCRQWFTGPPGRCVPIASSGFSGSRLYAVDGPGGERFVLKSFHASASRGHAEWVHRLATHLRGEGIVQVPEVMPTRDGGTIAVDATGTLWELCRFADGVAVSRPDPRQAAAAGEMLARIHAAAARLPGEWPREGPAIGVLQRVDQALRLRDVAWVARRDACLRQSIGRSEVGFLADVMERFDRAIRTFAAADGEAVVDRVSRLAPAPLRLQPVLRDVWCDHVLHADVRSAEVTGIVDLHAAAIDTPVTDIARLMGSWESPEGTLRLAPDQRHVGAMESYERIRPIEPRQRRLVGFFHRTAVLFGLDNWFRWTLDERRVFAPAGKVLTRIDRLLQELEPALAGLRDLEGIVD